MKTDNLVKCDECGILEPSEDMFWEFEAPETPNQIKVWNHFERKEIKAFACCEDCFYEIVGAERPEAVKTIVKTIFANIKDGKVTFSKEPLANAKESTIEAIRQAFMTGSHETLFTPSEQRLIYNEDSGYYEFCGVYPCNDKGVSIDTHSCDDMRSIDEVIDSAFIDEDFIPLH